MFLTRLLALLFCTATTLAAQGVATTLKIETRRALPVEEEPPNPALPDTATLPRVLPPNRKGVYNRCETALPLIAITFDDGPDPVLTPRLLDLLKERKIHATFFLVGRNAAAFPDVVRRIADEGHELGNHSWSHPLLTQLGKDSVESQLRRTHDAIIKACGVAPLLYRPPYGAVSISQRARIEKSFGYPAILWDVDPQDWKHPRSAQKVYDAIHTQTRAGSIILCHDIHETTIAAMPATLDDLTARGYRFATVTQLIAYTTPPELVGPPAPVTPPPVGTKLAPAATKPAASNTPPSIPLTEPQAPAPSSPKPPAIPEEVKRAEPARTP